MAAAIGHFRFGRFDLYAVNPPLVRMIAAVPFYFSRIDVDWRGYDPRIGSRSEFTVGLDIIRRNPDRAFQLLTMARWACIPISLLGAYICLRWATELYGFPGGILALCLWCFSPNIIANAQQIIPDVGASAFGICAAYCLWRWLERPGWGRASMAGVSLGLGLLCKMTLMVFVILWPLMTMLWMAMHERNSSARRSRPVQLAALLLLALFTVNLGYAFEEVGTPLGDFEFFSQTLSGRNVASAGEPVPGNRFTDSWFARMRVPLPKNYVLGFDWIRHELEAGKWSYLGGQWRFGGWWYYYLYALAVKAPIGTLLLVLLALGVSAVPFYRTKWKDELLLLIPSGVLLILASSQTGFNHHLRYVLPILPFMFVWCGKLGLAFSARNYALSAATASALAWSVASSLIVYPHSLSYFNELAGGPRNGHAHFAGLYCSNVDWGQDLFYVKRWVASHPDARPLRIAAGGIIDPRFAGLDYDLPAPGPTAAERRRRTPDRLLGPQPGWYAVSVNHLRARDKRFEYFLAFEPVDTVGYSTCIYHVSLDQANRVRAALGLAQIDAGIETEEPAARDVP